MTISRRVRYSVNSCCVEWVGVRSVERGEVDVARIVVVGLDPAMIIRYVIYIFYILFEDYL